MKKLAHIEDSELELSDKKLGERGFDIVHAYMCENTEFTDEEMIALPQPWRAIWLPIQCKADIDNGGFHQFFWNSEGALNAVLISDLERIGADHYLDVVRKATTLFSEFDYLEEKRNAGFSWRKFTAGYRQKRMERFDDEFYGLSPDLESAVGAHIRKNFFQFK